MKLTIEQTLSQITGFWKSQSQKNKILIISLTAGLIVIAAMFAILINNGGYVTLYSGLSSAETGEVMLRLHDLGIDFKTQSGGIILVPKEDEAMLQMTLASEGYPQSTLNYDLFSSNSGFMTTDYEKKKYLLFQLQNRLQDAITTIKGINRAIVTISLPEEDSFVLQEDKIPPTASVVLDIAPILKLSTQQIKGIEALVSKSVPGLENKNVAIVSNTGDIINNQYNDGSEELAYTKLELEKAINASIESKVIKLLSPVFGQNGLRIAVNTLVDINKRVSEQMIYTPVLDNGGLIHTQDLVKENTSTGGTTGGVPGTGTNTNVITYPQSNGITNGFQSETSSTNYLNNQTKEQIQREGYEIIDTTISVLIGVKNLTEEEISQYKQMVAYAAGVSTDKVAITKADFATVNTPASQISSGESEPFLKFPEGKGMVYLAVGGSILLLFIILLVVFLVRKVRSRNSNIEAEEILLNGMTDIRSYKRQKSELMAEEIVLNETREQSLKRQIKDFSASSPDIVAQLLRTWLKEDDGYE